MTVSKFAELVGLPDADEYDVLEIFLYGYGVSVVVEKEKIIDQTRWSTTHCSVVYHHQSNTYFQGTWMTGSSEMPDCDLDLTIVEVYPHVVTKTEYKTTPQET